MFCLCHWKPCRLRQLSGHFSRRSCRIKTRPNEFPVEMARFVAESVAPVLPRFSLLTAQGIRAPLAQA